jgi:hypothetical protein
MNFILKNDAEVNAYFKEWLDDINSQIMARKPGQAIENYPEIKTVFEEMQAAWSASFKENTISERMRHRDAAIQKLGKTIERNLK